MRILIVTPAPPGSRTGNRITATRWAKFLRQLGHVVRLAVSFEGQSCDALIALHARKSSPSIRRFQRQREGRPLIVALTGTDLYRDIRRSPPAAENLELASRIVLLQPAGLEMLPDSLHAKCHVIFQSARPVANSRPLQRRFEVIVSGHLRPVKDPFRAARAVRDLPAESRITVRHIGRALTDTVARTALREMQINPRYDWSGEVSHARSRRLIARARVLVISSKMEGGASVVAEAVVNRTPVIASRISGTRGMLGEGYPGFFAFGDTAGLRELLLRAESDRGWLATLKKCCAGRASQFSEKRERDNLRRLLSD